MPSTSSENIPEKNSFSVNRFVALKWYLQWLAFSLPALLLYSPIIFNTFLSDDHAVLLKTGVQGELNVDGFFRPLSDITLWVTYRLFKLNPFPYYLFQVLLHALNAVLLLQYCRKMMQHLTLMNNRNSLIALLAAGFFLTYPFHNEAIAWILGRGSLMAGTMAIAAMLVLVSEWKFSVKISVIAICYFLGMAAYETIIILPLMVTAYMMIMRAPVKQTGAMLLALVITFGLHAWLRIAVSGAFLGGYGEGFFSGLGISTLMGMFKSAGRIFLPPSDDSRSMMIKFVVVLLMTGVILFTLWKKSKNDKASRSVLLTQIICFAIAMLVPMWLGVSTRTSESDRFLYLPSFFFCTSTAFAVVYLFKQAKPRIIVVALCLIVQIFMLDENNRNWSRASMAVTRLMREAKTVSAGSGRLQIVNLPGETDGAYIFRVGFPEAIRLYQYDSSRIRVVSRLTRDQQLKLPQGEPGIAEQSPGMILVQPSTLVIKEDGNRENELLEAAADAGKLQQLIESMINREEEWSFAGAARASQIRVAVIRNKIPWKDLKIVVFRKQDKLLVWKLRGWMMLQY